MACDHADNYEAHELVKLGEFDYVCPDCGKQCWCCGEYFFKDDVVEINGKTYCKACYSFELSELEDAVESAIENYDDHGVD